MKPPFFLAVIVLMVPAMAFAQMSDADYCSALTQRYQTYVYNAATSRNPPSPDAENAIAQCKAGNTAAGIPVLEKKLRDARIDLPKRS